MALGKRKQVEQQPLFIATADLPSPKANPYYEAVNQVLAAHQFDPFVEQACATFYKSNVGRPGLAPGVYFRCLLVGYFEGIDSERGIAWRCADSRSLGLFLGVALDGRTPDHSTISRTRRLIDLETHQDVFAYMLKVLANHDLVSGKTVGVDSTTLEANAALRSLVRRDDGRTYQQFLTDLAQASGIETPTREDLSRIDKDRKKKGSNDDWHNPHDPEAKITKMKDGSTHLAHKAEHAVDMASGALLAVNVCDAVAGDTQTIVATVNMASENLAAVEDDARTAGKIDDDWASEAVGDKGYHSNDTMADLKEMGMRTYIAEPDRGPRVWTKPNATVEEATRSHEARDATYANRRRMRGQRGKDLMRRRGEVLERSFAHCYETGNMRRMHLRGRDNIAKRALVHGAGFNLGLLMRVKYGMPKPRNGSGAARAAVSASNGHVLRIYRSIVAVVVRVVRFGSTIWSIQLSQLQAAA